MTALALRSSDNIFGGFAIPAAGREARTLATSFWTEVGRLRGAGAGTSGALQDLETLARERGMTVEQDAVFTLAQRLLLVLPGNIPSPDLDVDSDGDMVFDWSGPDSKMVTLTLAEDGRISFAARLSPTKSRNGNDLFLESVPQEIIGLVRAVIRR